MQSNKIVDQFSLVEIVTGWYKICVVNCPNNGPFLPSEIGEICHGSKDRNAAVLVKSLKLETYIV